MVEETLGKCRKDPNELSTPAGQRPAGKGLTRGYAEFWQGAGGDPAKLPRLADTADEFNAIAKKLGASASDIDHRADASVTTAKRAPY